MRSTLHRDEPMPTQHRDRTHQPWCLSGLAASPADLNETARRLTRQRGHQPSLYELIEDLMAQQHIAAPFTDPARATTPPRGATA